MSSDDYIKLLFWDKVTNGKVLGTGDNDGNTIAGIFGLILIMGVIYFIYVAYNSFLNVILLFTVVFGFLYTLYIIFTTIINIKIKKINIKIGILFMLIPLIVFMICYITNAKLDIMYYHFNSLTTSIISMIVPNLILTRVINFMNKEHKTFLSRLFKPTIKLPFIKILLVVFVICISITVVIVSATNNFNDPFNPYIKYYNPSYDSVRNKAGDMKQIFSSTFVNKKNDIVNECMANGGYNGDTSEMSCIEYFLSDLEENLNQELLYYGYEISDYNIIHDENDNPVTASLKILDKSVNKKIDVKFDIINNVFI